MWGEVVVYSGGCITGSCGSVENRVVDVCGWCNCTGC